MNSNIHGWIAALSKLALYRARRNSLEAGSAGPAACNLSASWRRQLGERAGNLRTQGSAFTLIELLVVMAIIVSITALLVPAFNGINGGNDITKAAYDIAGTLDQARAYAMANKTYVFVGFEEVDASVSSSVSPQVSTGTAPYGRVAVAVVASKDGTKHYADAISGQASDWQANYADSTKPEYRGGHLTAISKMQRFENLHLASSSPSASSPSPSPASSSMARPTVTSDCNVGNTECKSQTPFTWPLGSPLSPSSSGYQYRFDKVIQFDPQGVARITTDINQDTIVPWMEVGLMQTHGNTVSTGSLGAAIQIDAMAGSTRIYRP